MTAMRMGYGLLLVAAVATLASCSCSGEAKVGGSLCDGDSPPEGCGQECGSPEAPPCPGGTYCGAAGTCTADCGAGVELACRGRQYCDESGRCVTREIDASVICADVAVEATPVTPTVMLIVDQSSSMNEDFAGAGSRWDVLRDSLLAQPGGLIFALQGSVEFGLAMYSGRESLPITECPILTTIPPAIDNSAAIESVYSGADPIADTPTGDAIDSVLNDLMSIPDPDPDPTIFIVATDGEPDRCEELNPQMGQAEAVAAAERAFAAGVRTFMISVGEGTVSAGHMQDMANAGLGAGAGGTAPYWVAGDDRGLRDALSEIVGGVLSCDITLNGSIDLADACTGTVELNGVALPCDDPNGWEAVDATHIRLLGTACDMLTGDSGATLTASFPCDVVII